MPIVVLGLNHRMAPVALREQFAFATEQIAAALQRLHEAVGVSESVLLSTCNRVEVYAAADQPPDLMLAALEAWLQRERPTAAPLRDCLYRWAEPQSVLHLFRVACGLDSMVLGETEILGQLKDAYEQALQLGRTGPRLNRAFQRAFHVAKHIRTHTHIQRGNVSVAAVAVDLAERIFSQLQDRGILVLGAGDTGEKTARALISRGAQHLFVSNRSPERAAALATALGGRAVRFDEWATVFDRVDIVISSTASPTPLLDRARLEPLLRARPPRPLLLIDIAVPRDIAPDVNQLETVFLYNIDDLQAVADECLRLRQQEIARCEQIIAEKAAALLNSRPPQP